MTRSNSNLVRLIILHRHNAVCAQNNILTKRLARMTAVRRRRHCEPPVKSRDNIDLP